MMSTMYARPTQAEQDAKRANAPAVRMFVDTLHRDPPGPATDDRMAQSNHLVEVIGLGVGSMASAVAGCTLRVMKRKAEPVFRSKKSRRLERQRRERLGVVRKAAGPASGDEHHDDDLVEAPRGDRFVKLFDHVNQTDTLADLLYAWVVQQTLTGVAPLWCRPSQLGYALPPAEFYMLPNALLMPLYAGYGYGPDQAYPFGAWRLFNYTPMYAGMAGANALGVTLDGREVKRHRLYHPLFRWDGLSPLTQYGVTFDVVEAIAQSWKSAMDNGFRPDVIASVKGATPEVLDTTRAMMEQTAGGSRNQRKIFLTSGEGLSIDTLCTEPRQMDYGEAWTQLVNFGLAVLGIPPAIAGVTEASSYAQLYASLKQFHTLSLGPKCRGIGQFLTKQVVYPFEKDVLVQLSPPAIDDEELLLKRADLMAKYSTITVDELRGRMGMDPLPAGMGGDQLIGKEPAPPEGGDVGAGDEDGLMQAGDANSQLESILGGAGGGAGGKTTPPGGTGPKGPANPAGAGSLPPRMAKGWGGGEEDEEAYESFLEMAREAIA
jgi:hypothetical protein